MAGLCLNKAPVTTGCLLKPGWQPFNPSPAAWLRQDFAEMGAVHLCVFIDKFYHWKMWKNRAVYK